MESNEPNSDDQGSVNYEDFYVKTEYEDEIRKDRAKFCYVCETSSIEYFFDCGNGLCLDCVRQHIRAQLEKYKLKIFSRNINFICAGSCRCNAEIAKIEELMDNDTRIIYHDVLLGMYLNQTEDILSCPNSNCKYYGYKISKCICYECIACEHKWSIEEKFTDIFSFGFNDLRTYYKKFLISKNCNNCQAPIEKAEGCVHMECNRCDYSFCWRCTDNWKGHSEFVCKGLYANEWDENLRPDFSIALFFIILLSFITKFIFSFNITILIMFHLLKCLIFIGLQLSNAFIIFKTIIFYKRFRRSQIIYFVLSILILIESIIYYIELHPYSEKIYFYIQLLVNSITFTIAYIKK